MLVTWQSVCVVLVRLNQRGSSDTEMFKNPRNTAVPIHLYQNITMPPSCQSHCCATNISQPKQYLVGSTGLVIFHWFWQTGMYYTLCYCVYLYSTRYQAVCCGEDELFSAGVVGGRQDDFACWCSIMSSQDKLLLGHADRIHSRHNLDLLSRLLIRHNLRRRIRCMLLVWSDSFFSTTPIRAIMCIEQSATTF